MINAVGSTIPAIYGRNRVGGAIFFFDIVAGVMYIGAAACWGETEQLDITLNDLPIGSYVGVTSEVFYGTTTQTVSTILQAARAAVGDTTYDHVHPGLAYVAMSIPTSAGFSGVPDIKITVKGRKVYDPRTATTAYSTNPFLCLRDLLVNDIFGGGIPAAKMDDGVGGTIQRSADYADDDFALAAPVSAATAAIGVAGILTGDYDYQVTYLDGVGNETMPSPTSNTVTATGDRIDLTGILVGPAGTSSRKLYRRQDSTGPWFLVTTIADNVTTIYTDNGAVTPFSPPVAAYVKPRWEIGIVLNSTSNLGDWIDTMRAHAPCWISHNGEAYCIIADQPDTAGSVWDFEESNILEGSMKVSKAGFSDSPTTVTVKFTDQKNNFNDASIRRELASVASGSDYRREAQYDLPGIPDSDIAMRLAIYYINRRLDDITISFDTPASVGILLLPGDLITVSYPVGFSGTPFRVTQISQSDDGHSWTITALEYTTAPYSDTIQETDPGTVGGLPDPWSIPPAPTSLILTTVILSGHSPVDAVAKIKVEWTPGDTPYYDTTRIEYSEDGSTYIQAGTSKLGPIYVENVILGNTYTFNLYTRSATGLESIAATDTIVPVFTDTTIPEIVQPLLTPLAYLSFYGPLSAQYTYSSFIDTAPTLPPTLSLSAGGVLLPGVHGYAYSWVTAKGESGLSPVAYITPGGLNRIVVIDDVLDGLPNVLYKKTYFTKTDDTALYFHGAMANGSTTISHNDLVELSITDDQLAPPSYDYLAGWEIVDNYLDPDSPPVIRGLRTAPNQLMPIGIPEAVHPNPTTGDPEIDITVKVISSTGARSDGFQIIKTGIGWPHVPQFDYLKNSMDLTMANGSNDNVSVNAASTQRLTGPSADFSITGLLAVVGGPSRDIRTTLYNTTPYVVTLKHEDGASTATNRFTLPFGADFQMASESGSVTVEYDFILQRWRVIASNQSGFGPVGGVGTGSIWNQNAVVQTASMRILHSASVGALGEANGFYALVDGNNDDIAVSPATGIIRFTDGGLTASPTIRSLLLDGNLGGMNHFFINKTGWAITVKHNYTGSPLGGHPFLCLGGVDATISIGPWSSMFVKHDDADAGWIIASIT